MFSLNYEYVDGIGMEQNFFLQVVVIEESISELRKFSISVNFIYFLA